MIANESALSEPSVIPWETRYRRYDALHAALDPIDQGFTLYDRDLRLAARNRTFLRLLELPSEMGFFGAPLESFIRFNAELGDHPALLVEDDPEVRKVARRALLELGFVVIEAENGNEAMQILDQTSGIALLLSDVMMPDDIDLRSSRLRRILESDPRNPRIIETVHGAGCMLSASVTRS